MDDNKEKTASPPDEKSVADTPVKGLKERLYDRLAMPLWVLDLLIALLVGALLLALYLGTRP